MRLLDLAARLVAVEAKLATLTGTTVDTDAPSSIDQLDARLSVVEAQVDQLIADKTQAHIDAIVAAPADAAPVTAEDVVALSSSADVPEAAAVVMNVIMDQQSADAVIDPEVAAVISAAVAAVVTADPTVVTDSDAITAAITAAVAEAPAPTTQEAIDAAADAVADVIASATGVDTIDPEVEDQIADAVATPADPALDDIEARMDAVEAKIDGLLGN
jgi:hypothetical protein